MGHPPGRTWRPWCEVTGTLGGGQIAHKRMELSRAGALHPLQTRTFDNPINFSSTGVWTTRKSGAHGGSELAMALRSDGNIVDVYRWDDGGGGAVSVAASVRSEERRVGSG